MTQGGWAVNTEDGGINMRTVSDTRRAAIVNWLCDEAKYLVLQGASDDEIEKIWEHRRGRALAVPVIVMMKD
jgi:hypothetical protein